MKKPLPGVPTGLPRDQPLFHELTPREQAFVMHPDVFSEPVKAALAVGYAATTANAKAHRMRKELMYFIAPLHQERIEQTGVTVDRIKDELAAIAFANEPDYYDTVDTAEGTVKYVRDITRLPKNMQRAIKKINYTNTVLPNGDVIQEIESVELYDKLAALRELAEIFGLHDAKLRQPADTDNEERVAIEFMEPEELETVVTMCNRASQRMQKLASQKRDSSAIEGKVTRRGK